MEKRPQNTGENSQEEDTYLEQIQRNLARLDQDKKKAKEAIANIVKKDRESKETLLSSESKTKEIKISHEDPRGIDLEKSSDKTGELRYARNR